MQNGVILDRDYNFWKGFIKDGDFDEAKLLEANYTKPQHAGIRKEAETLGWIGEGKAKREQEAAQTVLGRDRMFWAGHVDNGILNIEKLRSSKYTDKQIQEIAAGFEQHGWAKVPKEAVRPKEEKPADALPDDFPGRVKLEASGLVSLPQVRERAEAGTLREIEGIGEVTEGEIYEALGISVKQ